MARNRQRHYGDRPRSIRPTAQFKDELRALGHLLARSLIAPDSLALYRAIFAEAERLPVLGTIFYQHGPEHGRQNSGQVL
jgi:TetR/AcrR family transcriptional repressor of mexJK operon